MRTVSLALAVAVLALIAADPVRAGSDGALAERAFGAMMLVGAVCGVARGFGFAGTRRHLRVLLHPACCWTLVAAGVAGHFLL